MPDNIIDLITGLPRSDGGENEEVPPTLTIWDEIDITDPTQTKPMDDGAKLTTIDPMYQMKKFTKLFGPVGIGWGWQVMTQELIDAGPIYARDYNGLLRNEAGDLIPLNVNAKLHTCRIQLWYVLPQNVEKRYFIEGTGHTKFISQGRKGGVTIDWEYEKKSVTDAVTKAMSFLGMSADVRMGMFEDTEYVAQLRRDVELADSEDKIETETVHRQEYDEWYVKTLNLIKTSVGINELEVLFKSSQPRLDVQSNPEQRKEFRIAKNERFRELMPQPDPEEIDLNLPPGQGGPPHE